MLRTRLWMGTILILLAIGALLLDQRWPTISPFLFALVMSLGVAACYELLHLVGDVGRPPSWLCYLAIVLLLAVNWLPVLFPGQDPWRWLTGIVTGVLLAALLIEMARFRAPGQALGRIGQTLFISMYLGLLPSFLVQLRRPGTDQSAENIGRSTTALALAIFVPKCCDIGAYFTGRFLGRHKMSPALSPKKTWEGAAGGVVAAALAAIGIIRIGSGIAIGWWSTLGLGMTLAVAGILGDLAESLIKRDCLRKDASQIMPGFGGVLDVIDSILFAAPVAYWWLAILD
jgi:phosphatidate cytidylyltransferase